MPYLYYVMTRHYSKHNLYATLVVLLCCSSVYGQSWDQFSLAGMNEYREVSAFGGMERLTVVNAHIRAQWTELSGRPTAQYIGIHSPVYVWNGAAGLDITNQNQGSVNIKRFRASYNFVTSIGNNLISIGGRVGVLSAGLDGGELITPDGEYDDGLTDHKDPIINAAFQRGILPSIELSAAILRPGFQAGISWVDFPGAILNAQNAGILKNQQINFLMKYNLLLAENIELQTTVAAKSDFINIQSEIGAVFKINGNIFGGSNIRGYSSSSVDAVSFVFGHVLNDKISLFYVYDLGLSPLNRAHQGSHELLFKYRWNKLVGTGLPPKIIYNPRFL